MEGQQMKEQMVGSRSKSNERSGLVYERLHTEGLRKGRSRSSERKLVKSATTKTTTTKVETVVQHLYTDHFTREQKLQ